MIHVLLVDEQRLFSEAVRSLLTTAEDISEIGQTTTEEATIDYIETNKPNVVLIDIHMEAMNSIQTTIHIKENYPATKVIFLTSFAEKDLVIGGMIAGADGFLLKNIDKHNLIESIRNVHSGQTVFSGEAAQILAKKIVTIKYNRPEVLKGKLANRKIHFTDREVDVALLLADGLSNKQMAESLQLSEGTIKNYASGIYRHLQTRTRSEAVAYLQDLLAGFYDYTKEKQDKITS